MTHSPEKWHFGVLSFTGTGHLNPLISLSQELKRRGHRITFFDKPKIESRILSEGLEFFPIHIDNTYRGDKAKISSGAGICSEIATLRFNLNRVSHDVQGFLDNLPRAITEQGIESLIVNEIALSGPTVAELLNLPYFIISTSVPHNFGWNAYPWHAGFRFSASPVSWVADKLLALSVFRLRGPIAHAIDKVRCGAGLGPARKSSESFPPLAQITQLPQCLDFPRPTLPDNFHYAGPFMSNTAGPSVEFPWNRLDGRPLIYACLGTTRNAQPALLRLIAAACQDLDAQLVISLGGRFEPDSFGDLPGQPLVVRYAPQFEVMKRAAIVISHGGPNTTFEALLAGKPILAIPIAHDQPAIAARLERLKAAIVLPIMRITMQNIRSSVITLLRDASYRNAAASLQKSLRTLEGSKTAASIVESELVRYSLRRERQIAEESSPFGADLVPREN